MTIEINKSVTSQMVRIQWDCYPNGEDTQTLIVYNEYSEIVSEILLGDNHSPIKYRYGKYLINDNQLEDLATGLYLYKVVNTSDRECVLAVGSLKLEVDGDDPIVEDSKTIEYESPSEDTGYIVYNG